MTTAPPTHCLSAHDFAAPIDDRYFEDYVPGSTFEYGTVVVSEAEIVEFASRWDAQSFHTDAAAARDGTFGGLIASGWHTGAIASRIYIDHYLSHVASMASPGMDELRWPAPVRPGDELRLRATVQSSRVSRSSPIRGLVFSFAEMLNQHDQTVLTMKTMNFLRRRDPGAEPAG